MGGGQRWPSVVWALTSPGAVLASAGETFWKAQTPTGLCGQFPQVSDCQAPLGGGTLAPTGGLTTTNLLRRGETLSCGHGGGVCWLPCSWGAVRRRAAGPAVGQMRSAQSSSSAERGCGMPTVASNHSPHSYRLLSTLPVCLESL